MLSRTCKIRARLPTRLARRLFAWAKSHPDVALTMTTHASSPYAGSMRQKSRASVLEEVMNFRVIWVTGVTIVAFLAQAAHAQEVLKLAVGQRGNWATSVAEVGQRAGMFKK